MANYKFRSDELYRDSLPEDDRIERSFEAPIEPKSYHKHTTSRLRVRKEPDGEIIRILDNGEEVEAVSEHDGWTKLVDGTYVMSKFLK